MKYFTIAELTHSDTAIRKGINNNPTESAKLHITELVESILDPLREAWGSPIKVTSGYRGWQLNKAIGGSTTSAHSIGYAADLVPINRPMKEFKEFVKNWLITNKIPFDQYIDEHSGNSEWVHIGLKNNSGKQRKQFLLYKSGKYTVIK